MVLQIPPRYLRYVRSCGSRSKYTAPSDSEEGSVGEQVSCDNEAMVEQLKFQVITFNVAEHNSPKEDTNLKAILELDKKPDIISIGLEEAGDFDLLPDDQKHQDPWAKAFDELVYGHGYYLIDLTSVFQVKLRVYIHKKHMASVSHVETTTCQSGFVGGVSNIFKGATTVRFRLYGKHVAFINCHLTAFDHRTLDRNTEYWQFFADQEFSDPECSELYQHDYIIWSGDLNYRVEFDNLKVREMVANGSHLDLLPHDQLKTQQAKGLAFVGFKEGDITFAPSYKFDPGTDIYDTSKKQRVPSWCDRVLFRDKAIEELSGSFVNWDPLLSEDQSDSDSISSEISKHSHLAAPSPDKHKKTLFRHKVMRKKDSTLRLNEMRRKTLGVIRKINHDAENHTNGERNIEIKVGDFDEEDQFKELIHKITQVTESCRTDHETISVHHYKSYPEIKLSDHKPVSALLGVPFDLKTGSNERCVQMNPLATQWVKGKGLKIIISVSGRLNPLREHHWVGIFQTGWVNKSKYKSWAYVDKKNKPKGQYNMKVKFGSKAHPKQMDLHAVYFASRDTSQPVAYVELKSVVTV